MSEAAGKYRQVGGKRFEIVVDMGWRLGKVGIWSKGESPYLVPLASGSSAFDSEPGLLVR